MVLRKTYSVRKSVSLSTDLWTEVARLQRDLRQMKQAETVRDVMEAGIRTLRIERLGEASINQAPIRK